MIYSGSSYEFFELRIFGYGSGSYPYYLSGTVSAILYFTIQSYSTPIPEFTCLKLEIKLLLICSFFFCWIRIWNKNFGSGSRQKFRIQPDPDPQHCMLSVLHWERCGASFKLSRLQLVNMLVTGPTPAPAQYSIICSEKKLFLKCSC